VHKSDSYQGQSSLPGDCVYEIIRYRGILCTPVPEEVNVAVIQKKIVMNKSKSVAEFLSATANGSLFFRCLFRHYLNNNVRCHLVSNLNADICVAN